jgi:nucleoside phosphorylase
MGPSAAANEFTRYLSRGMVAAVSFGFAGALMPGLRCGTVLLPAAVRFSDGQRIPVDGKWHHAMLAALATNGRDPDVRDIAQVERVLGDSASKNDVADRCSAIAADMESGTLVKLGATHGVPVLVLRVVLDEFGDTIPAMLSAAVSQSGDLRLAEVVIGILRKPSALAPLARLALRRRVAGRSLRAAAASLDR